jgi:hypothetical protein
MRRWGREVQLRVRQPRQNEHPVSNFPLLYEQLVERITWEGKPTLALRHRLGAAYDAIIERPYNPAAIAETTEELLAYISSSEGRTHANCVAVDHFFCFRDDWEELWEDEPEELADILGDMGGALHDTIKAPEIAENFDSTPEQLLGRVREFLKRLSAA